ncbi:hypothetical protein [Nocardiopsis sp. YSL2]|uniref:hypothetical protein n=1 Tax=Nocardiopsis sp. YSL2 TaxID=2939492 RepID=UPI0026F444FC|nr:hypothetical protein [Nocardiopsis sp. YSL2]
MALLTRDQIKTAKDAAYEEVPVPEWSKNPAKPDCVRLKGLSGDERDELEQSTIQGRGKKRDVNMKGFRARLIAMSAVDADGNPIFTEADVEWLGGKSARALERVVNKAQELSGLSDSDVDELVGNSEPDPSGPSTSD